MILKHCIIDLKAAASLASFGNKLIPDGNTIGKDHVQSTTVRFLVSRLGLGFYKALAQFSSYHDKARIYLVSQSRLRCHYYLVSTSSKRFLLPLKCLDRSSRPLKFLNLPSAAW